MSCKPYGRGFQWTAREQQRAYELAVTVNLPYGSVAKLLTYEFGNPRTAGGVRAMLRIRFNWKKGTQHGNPSAGTRARLGRQET